MFLPGGLASSSLWPTGAAVLPVRTGLTALYFSAFWWSWLSHAQFLSRFRLAGLAWDLLHLGYMLGTAVMILHAGDACYYRPAPCRGHGQGACPTACMGGSAATRQSW
jgi:hypothetical protein